MSRAATVLRIAQRFFSQAEARQLERRSQQAAVEALTLWCLKESIIKAEGGTIWDALSGVELALENGGIRWLSAPPKGREEEWLLVSGQIRASCLLALAVRRAAAKSQPPDIVVHDLSEVPDRAKRLDVQWAYNLSKVY